MTRGATARLFVALDLPVEIRAQLVGWARRCAGSQRAASPTDTAVAVPAPPARARAGGADRRRPTARGQLRLLEADTLHVTLCFLGSRPTAEIEALGEALASACAESPALGELALGAPLWLPPRRPRALAVELHDDGPGLLGELHETVLRALSEVSDFELDRASARRGSRGAEHRFRPHITVARMRAGDAPRERSLPTTPALAFSAPSATLYRSWLTPTAADYEPLVTCALAAPNG